MFRFDLQQFGAAASATSDATMAAALAALPDGGATLDEDISESIQTPSHSVESSLEYFDDEEGKQRVELPGGAEGQASAAEAAAGAGGGPATTTAAPPQGAKPSAGSQPLPAAPAAPAEQQQPVTGAAPDPWAETEDIEYDDPDTGEKYAYRVPKAQAPKAKGYLTRRSVMDRTTGFMGKHRTWIEPLVANNQFEAVAPVIERGLQDREFADYIAAAYQRRLSGLPLDISAYQQQQQTAPQQAAPQTAATPAGGIDANAILAAIDGNAEVDEYTRNSFKVLAAPILEAVQRVNAGLQTQEQARAQAEQQARQQQLSVQQQRQVGAQMRQALLDTFPGEFTPQTPPEQFVRVFNYAQSSGIFQRYGTGPAAVVLAAQAMRSPLGLAGIGNQTAGSQAARSVAEIRAEGEALAAQAAGAVAQRVASGAPEGAAAPQAPRPIKVPRFVKDKRTGTMRALSPKEVGDFLNRYPNATI